MLCANVVQTASSYNRPSSSIMHSTTHSDTKMCAGLAVGKVALATLTQLTVKQEVAPHWHAIVRSPSMQHYVLLAMVWQL